MDQKQGSIWKKVLFVVPFAMGATGYLLAGETITDSFYAAVELYGMNLTSDSLNIWIEIARWTAPMATAAALLYVFTKLLVFLKWRIGCFFHDSVAVYTDSDIKISFGSEIREIYSIAVRSAAKSHIILMKNDADSFAFYRRNREALKNKKIYIGLHEMDLGLMKENQDISFFDISGIIAKLLWKKIRIWDREGVDSFKIVIWGTDTLAESILSCGLLLNVFSLSQHIKYSMAGDALFRRKHQRIPLMNDDKICYLWSESEEAWNALSDAHMVIVADELSPASFQAIAVRARNLLLLAT